MSQLDPNSVIPKELVITSVDDLLYEIGLCLTSVRERHKRKVINNPIVISIFNSIYLIERIISLIIPESYRNILLIVGEFGR